MGIRNTAIIGWIPLLIIKMGQTGGIAIFIRAALFFALPTFVLIVVIDSIYYRQLTVTAYNFFLVNIFENRSADFGIEPFGLFLTDILPMAFGPFLTLLVYLAAVPLELYLSKNKRKVPAVLTFAGFYLLVISLIPHKESRFMLPVMPFLFLLAAQAFTFLAKKDPFIGYVFLIVLFLNSLNELGMFFGQSVVNQPYWMPVDYVLRTDQSPESIYLLEKHDIALNSWTHGSNLTL